MSVMKSLSPEIAARLYAARPRGASAPRGLPRQSRYYSPSFSQFAATFPAQMSSFVG